MSLPSKDNAHILSDQQAFREAYARAREFFGKIEGVLGVGFGQKQTGGQYKNDIAIVVFVGEKRKEEELAPGQRIPVSFEGYQTDVRIVRKAAFNTCDNQTEYSTIQGGMQISARMDSQTGLYEFGTLGCIVRKRNDSGRENVYLLTNKHVLYGNGAGAKDYVYHPFPSSTNTKKFVTPGPSTTLGPTEALTGFGDVPYIIPGDTTPTGFFVDCSVARIDIDCKCLGSSCTKDQIKYAESIIDLQVNGVDTISDVRSVINDPSIINQKVYKVGRTTGKTTGIVRLIGATVLSPPDPAGAGGAQITVHNTIEIDFDPTSTSTGVNCKGHARFTEHGDSGSVILDEQGRVIGLHSLGPEAGSPSTAASNACHILPVLDILNICIPTTTGTSHGSSRATDGSGIAPAIVSVGDFVTPDGQIAFSSQQNAVLVMPAPTPAQQMPATDEELNHMRDLLAVLRSTQKGRDLHSVFAEIRREIGYLVRNSRPVKVTWHRNKGPAFMAHVLNHLKGETDHIPHEVDGIPIITLLTRMREVLRQHGSHPLQQAIEQYGDDLMNMLTIAKCDSAQACIVYLQEKETV